VRVFRDRLSLPEKCENELYQKYKFPRNAILELTDLTATNLHHTNKNHTVRILKNPSQVSKDHNKLANCHITANFLRLGLPANFVFT
jgi:protein-tyrosine phosphatase